MTHSEHLAEADRFIAECKSRIARQREIIATAYQNGHSTDILVSMLRALVIASLRQPNAITVVQQRCTLNGIMVAIP